MQHRTQVHIYINFYQLFTSSLQNNRVITGLQHSGVHLPSQPPRSIFFLFRNLWPVRSRMINQLFYNLWIRLIMSHLTSHSSPWNFSFCYPFMSVLLFLILSNLIRLLFSDVNEQDFYHSDKYIGATIARQRYVKANGITSTRSVSRLVLYQATVLDFPTYLH